MKMTQSVRVWSRVNAYSAQWSPNGQSCKHLPPCVHACLSVRVLVGVSEVLMMPVTPPSLLVTPTTFGWNKEDKIRKIQNILPLFDVYGRSEHFSHFHLLFESSVHLSVSPTHSLSFSLAPRGVSSTRGRVREREREAPSWVHLLGRGAQWTRVSFAFVRTHTHEREKERDIHTALIRLSYSKEQFK